ncbi:family 78 glycoside hydrolase catalytic domain [Parabacteroides sp. Marseille-P3160]|uniref:family 78 glycoside hydrolase catalytic domain n=1 Tax=Parabacteroides sp. Marseille-P3160 TaxID=1917887 RepID=UPI0009BADDD7|nr:family 78 glycoside hydrolase catalytic domain [Parabacteroides sp. Marseille-P3160]
MKINFILLELFITILLLTACSVRNEKVTPTHLRTEFLTEPIGIDNPNPRFTWEYSGEEKGFSIRKNEIRIGTDPDRMEVYIPGSPLKPFTKYYWTVTVWDQKGRRCPTSEPATFETGRMDTSADSWTVPWITDQHDKEFEPAPLFRSTFSPKDSIREARLYVASAGYHELFLNGERVGENYLDPGYTHFDKRILYVSHDVTDLVQPGQKNALAAVLGNGWYNEQSVAVWNFHLASWRQRPRFSCQLRVTYANGETEKWETNDKEWKTSTGPYTYNNIYSGDHYDARLEEKGWNMADFDDNQWKPAILTHSPAPLIVSQQMPGIRITEEMEPTDMQKFNDQLYVYSFPRNIAGLCRLAVKGEKGTRITIKHGELLKKDGRLEQGNINVYYHPVKPYEIFQTDVFTLAGTGEEEIFMPSFTYHGFQYVEVESSKPVTLAKESLTALFMHTDLPPVGNFSCSNPLLNDIWDATMQSYRSNIHSIPTDCPQREKNGWTADAHIAVDLGLLGFDGITFYEKWMDDFIDNQRKTGDISGIIPSSGWGFGEWPGPVWDAALFIIPNALYNYYGDTLCIRKIYPALERYLDYLKTKEKEGYLTFGLGDWVYWKSTTPNEYTSTAYYYLDYMLMARFASLLGKDPSVYQEKADELKGLINQKFFDAASGRYANGTQTAQALALYLGLPPKGKEQQVADLLHKVVADNQYYLDFGLLGSKTVPAMLTRYGYLSDVMKMVTKTDAPSWGYWVETKGCTTLPETWTLSPEFKDASLNHVFMGDVSAWMMNQLAGINYDATRPGFRHIRFTPHFAEELDWAKGEYHSVRGLITSEWKRDGDSVKLTVQVPADCTAEIQIGDEVKKVKSGIYTFTYHK